MGLGGNIFWHRLKEGDAMPQQLPIGILPGPFNSVLIDENLR